MRRLSDVVFSLCLALGAALVCFAPVVADHLGHGSHKVAVFIWATRAAAIVIMTLSVFRLIDNPYDERSGNADE